MKALIGISPVGVVSFLSNLWSGNASDRFIFLRSGILDMFEPGDAVMADRGFTVRDLLAEKCAYLIMPPFTKKCNVGKEKNLPLTSNDIIKTKKIANCRIHVERAIQRVKTIKMLYGQISLKPLLDQILLIACVLTNLWGPFLKK